MCCGYTSEAHQRGASNEYPLHMLFTENWRRFYQDYQQILLFNKSQKGKTLSYGMRSSPPSELNISAIWIVHHNLKINKGVVNMLEKIYGKWHKHEAQLYPRHQRKARQGQIMAKKNAKYEIIDIQSTLVISNSKGLSEILRDIRSSTYQVCRIEEKIIWLTTFNKLIGNWTFEVRDILKILWKRGEIAP